MSTSSLNLESKSHISAEDDEACGGCPIQASVEWLRQFIARFRQGSGDSRLENIQGGKKL